MQQPPIIRVARVTISLLAITAWLFAANHCIVAELLPQTPVPSAEHEHCPGHPAPVGEQKSNGCDGSSCCKSLSAPLALSKTVVQFDMLSFATKDYPAASSIDLGELHLALIAEVDTGPPRSTSFAESVLQRSILAHAPPVA